MIRDTSTRDVIISGDATTKTFSVLAGGHIMKVLSGLYANPIDAMVREYLTNMGDAVIALQRENPSAEIIPAELNIPSMLQPILEFKDYGIGMSLDTVFEIYTVFGSSSKDRSNDEAGMFGLGSKTAFCYNNGQSWNIESRYGGELHRFIAYVNSDNVPTLAHVGSEPTTEHSGLTISIPINTEDIPAVKAAAIKHAKFFPHPLKIDGEVYTNPDKVVFQGEVSTVYETTNTVQDTVLVVMGGVAYPANSGLQYSDTVFKRGTSYYVVLHGNIGDFDVTPSRDTLQWTPKTTKAARELYTTFKKEYVEYIKSCIASYSTPYEKLVEQIKIYDNHDYQITQLLDSSTRHGYHHYSVTLNDEDIVKYSPTFKKIKPEFKVYLSRWATGVGFYSVINDGSEKRAKSIISAIARQASTKILVFPKSYTKSSIATLMGGIPQDSIFTLTELCDKYKGTAQEVRDRDYTSRTKTSGNKKSQPRVYDVLTYRRVDYPEVVKGQNLYYFKVPSYVTRAKTGNNDLNLYEFIIRHNEHAVAADMYGNMYLVREQDVIDGKFKGWKCARTFFENNLLEVVKKEPVASFDVGSSVHKALTTLLPDSFNEGTGHMLTKFLKNYDEKDRIPTLVLLDTILPSATKYGTNVFTYARNLCHSTTVQKYNDILEKKMDDYKYYDSTNVGKELLKIKTLIDKLYANVPLFVTLLNMNRSNYIDLKLTPDEKKAWKEYLDTNLTT